MLKIGFGALIIAGVAAVGIAGFRDQKGEQTHIEWFNDMSHQPRVNAQVRSTFFADGRGERAPVAGTVPIGYTVLGSYYQTEGNNLGSGIGGFANQPDYFNTGRIGDMYGDGIPENLASRGEELLKRGQERYQINCSHCHGFAGKGNGPVKTFGLMTIADLTNEPIRKQPDGQIFNTITHGKNTMGAHGPIITVEDRWAIVSYVRALQKVSEGKLNAEEKK
jgi:mono/diheme cytochrome c family protein